MTAVQEAVVRETIETAFKIAKDGHIENATQMFSLARTQSRTLADPEKLQAAIRYDLSAYVRERERYRSLLRHWMRGRNKLVVLADSLGLPRPEDKKKDKRAGADHTYSGLLSQDPADIAIDSLCQRFMTTGEALAILQREPSLGWDASFVLHVGLNDCANRMFLEAERLSLSLLSEETRDLVIEFSRKYRHEILRYLPTNHYTPLVEFRENLGAIVAMLKARKARNIILTTIILPPKNFWNHTPGINWNFGLYNAQIMDAAHRHGVTLLDLDRHVWEALHEDVLLSDGMHLSSVGHQMMADRIKELIL